MAFTPKDWKDSPDTSTPLSAAAMEDMETRVTNYADSLGGLGYIQVADYATGDGTTDDTTAFQSAVDDAATAGVPLYINPGKTYLINGQVTISTHFFTWIMPFAGFNDPTVTGIGSKILCGNASAPCLLFGASGGMKGLRVEGLKVWAKTDRDHRVPLVQFGYTNPSANQGLNDFHLYNLMADGRNFRTDAFLFHTCYTGSVYSTHVQNMGGINGTANSGTPGSVGGGVAFTIKTGNCNVGNMGFYNCASLQAPVGWILDEYNNPTNLINSTNFVNCKALGPSGAQTFVVGTLSGSQSIGDSAIVLSDATGFAIGQWVTAIRSDSRVYVSQVSNVAGGTVTIRGTLPFTMAANDTLVAGNWHTVAGGAPNSTIISDNPHWENCNGFLGSGPDGVKIRMAHIGNLLHRGVYLARASTQVELDGIQSGGSITIPDNAIMFHQANDSGNSRNRVKGACIADWHAGSATNPKMIQVDGGQNVAYNERFNGIPAVLGVWHQDTTVAANQSAVQLTGPQGAVRPVCVPHYGALVGLQINASSARSAGTLTATVYKNGSSTALTAVLDGTNTTRKLTEYENTTVTVSPNDRLDVRVTTDGTWAPTANNLDATIWVEQ